MEIWWMNESSKAASRESNLKIEFKLCGKAAERERKGTAFEINLIFSRFRRLAVCKSRRLSRINCDTKRARAKRSASKKSTPQDSYLRWDFVMKNRTAIFVSSDNS